MEILKGLAYILVGLFTTAYVFNHIDPWAGITTGIAFIAILIHYLKRKNR